MTGGAARRPAVAVIGSGVADASLREHARVVGAAVARCGAVLLCGGLDGVMAAACEGAAAILGPGSGRIVGILPGVEPGAANSWVDVAVATGAGQARNVMLVQSAAAVVAVGGESGTLAEIAHAWKAGKPVCAYLPAGGWGERLAGATLDGRYQRPIASAGSAAELETWLRATLASSPDAHRGGGRT